MNPMNPGGLTDDELLRLARLLQQTRGEGLAFINPGEAQMLRDAGGSGEPIPGTQGFGVGGGRFGVTNQTKQKLTQVSLLEVMNLKKNQTKEHLRQDLKLLLRENLKVEVTVLKVADPLLPHLPNSMTS